jgi:iron(III) transport system substrate-binding protein
VGAPPRSASVLAPVELEPDVLAGIYGGNTVIGDNPLYDQKGMWFGAALSGFGIVFNRDLLRELGFVNADGSLREPKRWADLCDPRFEGWIALVNPAQSGSVTTAYEAILQRRGWEDGWRILHRLAANARTFSASSPRAPTDVSLGDAAAGICIDFYGRYQSQAIMDASGDEVSETNGIAPRVGYVDPVGETVIDPDPIAMLRGAPSPELAKRFILFTLSTEGQALWNFRAKSRLVAPPADGFGPERYELRRMPVRPSIYVEHFARLIDPVDPFTIATAVKNANPDYRAFLPAMFVAMAIENRALLHSAWRAIISHPSYPRQTSIGDAGTPIVTADDVSDATLKAMLQHFDSFPRIPGPGGVLIPLGDATRLKELRDGWIAGGWRGEGLWATDAAQVEVLRSIMTEHYRDAYEAILELARESSVGAGGGS